jgi:integrase
LTLGRIDEVALSDARDAAQHRRAKAALGEAIPARKPTSDITLREFLDKHYESWMKATHRGRAGQVERIRWAFKDLLDQKLSEITTGRVERWRATRRNQQRRLQSPEKTPPRSVSRATMNRDIQALRAALARATEWGPLSMNPLARMKQSTEDENSIIRYLSRDEEERLRKALADRDDSRRAARKSANEWRRQRGYEPWPEHGTYTDYVTPLVLVALNTGLRRGELLQLRWRDIELLHKNLTVRGEGAKTGQTRHVPLNSEIVQVLRSWKPADVEADWCVFSGSTSTTPLTEARKAWKAIITAAKIGRFRFHDLRHTFASKLVMAGVDLNTVRELPGHKKISMTLRYAHLAPQHKADAVEKLVR